MKNVTPLPTIDLRTIYLMNGQIMFAEYVGMDADTEDYIVKCPCMVMIGQNKQIAMSTAYPFTNIEDEIKINWRHVTVMSDLEWNGQLKNEYNNFWQQIRAQAAGIVMAGPGQMPKGPGQTPGPMKPTIVKG